MYPRGSDNLTLPSAQNTAAYNRPMHRASRRGERCNIPYGGGRRLGESRFAPSAVLCFRHGDGGHGGMELSVWEWDIGITEFVDMIQSPERPETSKKDVAVCLAIFAFM